jgi:serine/threonine-protein kinase
MGVVYLGRDSLLERDVALKMIGPNVLTPELRHRFLREARIVARMDHPGVLSVHDIGEHEESLFMVMPYVSGSSLREVLDAASLDLGEIVELGIQVAEALAYSHTLDIVHRDIKPENILVVRDGRQRIRVKIGDFGLAISPSDPRLTHSGTLLGTLGYVSPEQLLGKTVDARSDIYAFGTVLYECIAGERPFKGNVRAILHRIVHEPPRSLRTYRADIGGELDGAVMACLEKDPARRMASARALVAALTRCRTRTTRRGSPTGTGYGTRSALPECDSALPTFRAPPARRRRVAAAMFGVAALAVAGVTLIAQPPHVPRLPSCSVAAESALATAGTLTDLSAPKTAMAEPAAAHVGAKAHEADRRHPGPGRLERSQLHGRARSSARP